MKMMKTIMMLWLVFGAVLVVHAQESWNVCNQFGGPQHSRYISIVNYFVRNASQLRTGMFMLVGLPGANSMRAVSARLGRPDGNTLEVTLKAGEVYLTWFNLVVENTQLVFTFQGMAGRHQENDTNLCAYSYPLAKFRCYFAFNVGTRNVATSKEYPYVFPKDFRPSLAFQYQADLSTDDERQFSHTVFFLHQRPIYHPKGHSAEGVLVGFERKLRFIDFFVDSVKETEMNMQRCNDCTLKAGGSYGCGNGECYHSHPKPENTVTINILINNVPLDYRILGIYNTLQNGYWVFLRKKQDEYICHDLLCQDPLKYYRLRTNLHCSEMADLESIDKEPDYFVNNYMPPEFEENGFEPKDDQMFTLQTVARLRNVSIVADIQPTVRTLTKLEIMLSVAVPLVIVIVLVLCLIRRLRRYRRAQRKKDKKDGSKPFKSFMSLFSLGDSTSKREGGTTTTTTISNLERFSTKEKARRATDGTNTTSRSARKTTTERTRKTSPERTRKTTTERTRTLSRIQTTNTPVESKARTENKGNRESEAITSVDKPYRRFSSPGTKKR